MIQSPVLVVVVGATDVVVFDIEFQLFLLALWLLPVKSFTQY